MYLVSPTSYGAALYNAKDPTTFMLTEAGASLAPTYSSNGFFFNGKTQYLKTGIIPSTNLTTSNNTVAIRSRSNDIGNCEMGAYMSSTQNQYYDIYTNTARLGAYSDANTLDVSNTDGTANFFFNARSTTLRTVRRNKTQLGQKVTTMAGTPPSIEMYIGARNDNGGPNIYSIREISTIIVWSTALSDANCDIVSDLLDDFNLNVVAGGR